MKTPGPVFAAILLLAAASSADAHTPPEGLVWMALNEINADYFSRDDPTNRPPLVTWVPDGMLRPVDVSPDGRTDWVVDFGAAGLSAFCGTGGCTRVLYVSGGDTGFIRAFDAQAIEFDVVQREGETRVEAQVHHLNCRPAQAECWFAWTWDPVLNQLVERPAADGVTRLEGGGFERIDSERSNVPDNLPAELSDIWFASRLTCRDYSDDGSVALRPEFRSIPDIDGDRRRDWIETPPVCEAENAGVVRYALWVTAGDETLEQAYQSEGERYPSIDISTTPATVLENPACGDHEPCPDARLRWDRGRGRFVAAAQ
jgi:hypothetical protein